jgi:hypothetical protein
MRVRGHFIIMSYYTKESWKLVLSRLGDVEAFTSGALLKQVLPEHDGCNEILRDTELSKRLLLVLHSLAELLGFRITNPKLLCVALTEKKFWTQPILTPYIHLMLALTETCVYSGFVALPVQILCIVYSTYLEGGIEAPLFQKLRDQLFTPMLLQLSKAWEVNSSGVVYRYANPLLLRLPDPPAPFNTPPFVQTGPLKNYGNRVVPRCFHGLLAGILPSGYDCLLRSTVPCPFKLSL